MNTLGLIGSMESAKWEFLTEFRQEFITTKYGNVKLMLGQIHANDVALLVRGGGGSFAPHLINHKANIEAMRLVGVKSIISTCMVGSLKNTISVEQIVIPNQILDCTKNLISFYDQDVEFRDCDVTEPFCHRMRESINSAAIAHEENPVSVCYVGVTGPRFETAAEVRMFAQIGGDVVGMTIVQEAFLCREIGICYAAIGGVVNLGAGLASGPLKAANFRQPRNQAMTIIERIIKEYLSKAHNFHSTSICTCCNTPS